MRIERHHHAGRNDQTKKGEGQKQHDDEHQAAGHRRLRDVVRDLPGDHQPNFQLYQCDIEIGNNTILVNMGDNMITYITYNTFNRMYTSNRGYCIQTSDWLNNLTQQSNLISGVAQRNRFQFFKEIYTRLDALKERVEKG